ncbi:Peroxidase 4 [Hordeum vulgare]|nr:Peroxidase 4 [Hordeum vulgare]
MAAGGASVQLSTGFYSSSCPGALGAVASLVQSAVANEPRMGASILRLFFHDCFLQGCDGSLLLDDTVSFQGEKMATPNNGSFDEKNIRRRVYDAFNVLIALRVIAKEKKEIWWMGLSNYRYEKLKKLEFDDLQNIKLRNETLQSSAENVNGIRLPFVLVKITLVLNLQSDIPMFTTAELM